MVINSLSYYLVNGTYLRQLINSSDIDYIMEFKEFLMIKLNMKTIPGKFSLNKRQYRFFINDDQKLWSRQNFGLSLKYA